jgi:uncharacterized integral membrane protein
MTGRWWAAFTAGPAYPPEPADTRTVPLVGLDLPGRATLAIAVVTVVLLLDYSRTFLPDDLFASGLSPAAARAIALERAVLFGLVPLLVVLAVFRDQPSRYGLALGEWRWGLGLVVVGCALMTPLVLWFATLPEVRAYYGPSAAPWPELLAVNGLELTSAEFAFRGFLLMTLLRVIGPLAVVVAALPFVFGHLGKPELELFSTLAGGLVYGWLAWRTRSIVWGAIGHTYILTLVTVAAAG